MTIQRHRGLTEPAADAAIDTACRVLRLPTLRARLSRRRAPGCRSVWYRPRHEPGELAERAAGLILCRAPLMGGGGASNPG
jgi:hypothetical protein